MDGTADSTLPTIPQQEVASSVRAEEARTGVRRAYFEDVKDFVATPIYLGDRLLPGMRLEGPAIIERMGDTVVLPPQTRASVDGFNNLILEVQRDVKID